jgi:DNA-binding CsgD family transcriptional regulator
MEAIKYLFSRLKIKRKREARWFQLDEPMLTELKDLAKREHRRVRDVEAELIEEGLAIMQAKQELIKKWKSLSPREQQVVALACRGYTYGQVALKLGISVETVKTHIRNTMNKIDVHGLGVLQKTFSGWDFSEWEKKKT